MKKKTDMTQDDVIEIHKSRLEAYQKLLKQKLRE